MELPVDVIEHEGEQYRVSYEEWLACGNCEQAWQITSPNDSDEEHREEPPTDANTTCPECGAAGGHTYEKRHSFFIKQTWWFDNPEPDVDMHVDAFRHQANRFEALAANGWTMTRSTGEHVTFERVESRDVGGSGDDYRVDDTLE